MNMIRVMNPTNMKMGERLNHARSIPSMSPAGREGEKEGRGGAVGKLRAGEGGRGAG